MPGIVQVSTYEPAPPAGLNVALAVVLLGENCEAAVFGPLATDQDPEPLAVREALADGQIEDGEMPTDAVRGGLTIVAVAGTFALAQTPAVVAT